MKTYLYDSCHRKINYLRLSVTDRCNFRCQYCMPAGGIVKRAHSEVLSFEELLQLAKTAVSLGVEKIRVTGGEPLLRKGILDFLAEIKSIPGLKYLAVTTNGHNLLQTAPRLQQIGLTSLNVSVDSLDPDTFATVTRTGELKPVLDGIRYAHALGIPIKLNVVVMRGINDHEIVNFATLANDYNWSVRFIELMPSSPCNANLKGVSADEIYQTISKQYLLEKLNNNELSGPSQDYKLVGGKGRIGVISAMSCPFCSSCNRIRITSTGGMKNCLFNEEETDLKPYLAAGDLYGLKQAMIENVLLKPEKHHIHWGDSVNPSLQMVSVGG
ncbi:cyclic pyranopterin monophosphate synthase subunit MoaA [Desulfuromusa kysingii]|uniref:GTP 3',8-cyclase n=1 Tax=Desulfuromusa kysingii TaxID=37625 RepID=A0A1H4A222_9BACT|nr:GTP 3',8-cyclase MoaA [Desulfuromusa kysingii]SEA29930.1 cyclic pyranopterin monophosphate synthase subunit MoaA [Desulfuromusa kysingii]